MAGVPVVPEGVLRVGHSPRPGSPARRGAFFLARPLGDSPPRSVPDEESPGVARVRLDEIDRTPPRSPEAREVLLTVAAGVAAYPLRVLVDEGQASGGFLWAPKRGTRRVSTATGGVRGPSYNKYEIIELPIKMSQGLSCGRYPRRFPAKTLVSRPAH